MPRISSAVASTPLYQSVSRQRMRWNMRSEASSLRAGPRSDGRRWRSSVRRSSSWTALSRLNLVANAPHRFDQFAREALIDLVAQVVNVGIDHVGERVQVVAPDMVGDLGTRQHLSRVAHQVLEKRELLGGELDDAVASANLVPHQVQYQVADS